MEKLQKDYENHCHSLWDENSSLPGSEPVWQGQLNDCMMYLYFLRAGISVWQSGDQRLTEVTDLKLLTDRLAFEFSKGLGEDFNSKEMTRVAERILEVDPKIYGAAKAALMGHVFEGLADGGLRADWKFWKALEPNVQRASELNRDDPEFQELERIVRTRGYAPQPTKQLAEALISSGPTFYEGYYLLAYAEWKLGNHEASIRDLRTAIQLAPENLKLKDTLRSLIRPDADLDSFKMTVQFGIRLDGILQ